MASAIRVRSKTGGDERLDDASGRLKMKTKTMMIAAALAASAMASASSADAPARLDQGVYSSRADAPMRIEARLRAYSCIARSAVAMGYWTGPTRAAARLGALRQCAVRTPRYMACFIASCS
jgi:hypothetical protein